MLEITITEKPKTEKIIKKHLKGCVWSDREVNVSFAECPHCSVFSNYEN